MISVAALLGCSSLALFSSSARAGSGEIAAIYAKTYNGYTRQHLPDGSLRPVAYSFVEGGRFGGTAHDKSIDGLPFLTIARSVAATLREQGYVPSADPKQVELMIFVFWGTTTGAGPGRFDQGEANLQSALREYGSRPAAQPGATESGPGSTDHNLNNAAESALEQALMLQGLVNDQRDQNNFDNAGVLGFRDALRTASEIPWFSQSRDLVAELEQDRYFVVLKAYDFQVARKQKQIKVLWETRFSIGAQGNAFDEQLTGMLKTAAPFFGRDTKGLVRDPVPEGKVKLGEARVMDQSSDK